MRPGARNSGNSIQPWAGRLLTRMPGEKLDASLRQARTRHRMLAPCPDSATKRTLLAREEWLIRCLEEEVARRSADADRRTAVAKGGQ